MANIMHLFCIAFIALVVAPSEIQSLEREMTINVDPGRKECFFQNVKIGNILDIEYQVIDGGKGDLDISFSLHSPTDRQIVYDQKKSDNSHRIDITEDGDFKMCWDNTFSHYSKKTVFFEIIVEDEEEGPWENADIAYDQLSPDEIYEIKLQDILDSITRVKGNLNKVRHLQEILRNFEARDRNLAEGTYVWVNAWSILQITLMLAVGAVQVIMVKSLFDEKSRLQQLWKKKGSLLN